jgi:hypothetical protein
MIEEKTKPSLNRQKEIGEIETQGRAIVFRRDHGFLKLIGSVLFLFSFLFVPFSCFFAEELIRKR